MNSAINFSQFAYKRTKPSLTFYQRKDKENRPHALQELSKPRSPINATPGRTHVAPHCTSSPTPGGRKRVRVVPETPDREWPTRRTSTAALGVVRMAGRRRKRWRIPSSSDEDAARARAIETESGSRDIHSGCAGNTTSTGVAAAGGLFSSAVISKRRKRNGEQRIEDGGAEVSRKDIRTKKPTKLPGRFLKPLKVDEYMVDAAPSVRDVETEEGGVGKRSGELRFRKRVSNNVVDLCTDSEDDSVCCVAVKRGSRGERSSLPRGVFEFTSDSESESELQSVMASKAVKRSKRTKSNARNIVRPASPDSDGWFSCRAPPSNQRKPQSKQPPPVNVSDRRGDLTRLKELFPQHEESYLRGKLEECCDVVEEAIANILPSEDTSPFPKRRLRGSRLRGRRQLSDDSLLPSSSEEEEEEEEDMPAFCTNKVSEDDVKTRRRGGGRRLLLDETPDKGSSTHTRVKRAKRILSLTSSSESDEEREGVGVGEEALVRDRREESELKQVGKCDRKDVSRVSRVKVSHGGASPRSKLKCFTYDKSPTSSTLELTRVDGGSGEEEEMVMVDKNHRDGGDEGKCEGRGREVGGERVNKLVGESGVGEKRGSRGREKMTVEQVRELLNEDEPLSSEPCSPIELNDSDGVGKSAEPSGSSRQREGGGRSDREETPDVEVVERESSDDSQCSNDNDFSDRQKRAILALLNSCSHGEACDIPGCSNTKADLLLAKRPFPTWKHLLEVFSCTKGLSEQLLDGCVCLLEERRMLATLLEECQRISSSIKRLVGSLREGKANNVLRSNADVCFTPPKMLNPDLVLKPYQNVGVSWLALLHSQNLNAILADEMGLGKTIQAIVFLSHLYELGWRGPHLIVVPTSTLDNWARELAKWSPSLNVLTYWGSQSERADMRYEVIHGDHQNYYDVILSTYTVCIGQSDDRKFFRKLHLKTLVLDEGHMLKNMSTQKYAHLMRIQAERRLLLTGTPLQNNLLELMSLLSFVMPSVFRPYLQPLQTAFRHRQHGTELGAYYMEQVSRAKEIVRPFILRRLKSEVLQQLPHKHVSLERCPLTPEQWSVYCDIVKQGRRVVKNGKGAELTKTMTVLTNLRKAANHPLLLRNHYSDDVIAKMSKDILQEASHRDADSDLVREDMTVMSDFELHNLCSVHDALRKYSLPSDLVRESGKFKFLEKKLTECKQQGDRVLLFSQFTMMLDIVGAWLQLLGHTHLRLDGNTRMNERQGLIDLYNSDAGILVFLLSTKAGGLGINLTAANVVVIHDIDFNPYNDKQAEDRCHRVGQTREVSILRLVGRATVEEDMLKCAEQKLKLEHDMTAGDQLNKTDIASLLSQGLKPSRV